MGRFKGKLGHLVLDPETGSSLWALLGETGPGQASKGTSQIQSGERQTKGVDLEIAGPKSLWLSNFQRT